MSWWLTVSSRSSYYNKELYPKCCKTPRSTSQRKCWKIFEWLQSKLTYKSPDSSNSYAMKVECLKSIFCAPRVGKKMRKGRVRRKKTVFFFTWNHLLQFFFIFFYFWVVTNAGNIQYWKLLIYDVDCLVLVAYKKIV